MLVEVKARPWFEPHGQDVSTVLDHGNRMLHPEFSVEHLTSADDTPRVVVMLWMHLRIVSSEQPIHGRSQACECASGRRAGGSATGRSRSCGGGPPSEEAAVTPLWPGRMWHPSGPPTECGRWVGFSSRP